ASDTLTGGSGMTASTGAKGLGGADQYSQNFAKSQQGLLAVVNELMKRGVPYSELGQLPISGDWAQSSLDMADPLQQLYAANAGKYDTKGNQILGTLRNAMTATPLTGEGLMGLNQYS